MDYRYRVEYSSRKTASVEVTPSGVVLLRVPKGTNEGTIEYLLKKYEKEIETGLKDMEEVRKKAAEKEAEEKAEAERNSLEKSLNFYGTEIKYKIVFDDLNAGSILVTQDLSVVVTVPRFFSVWEAEDFAERHKRWIVNRLGEKKSRSDELNEGDDGERNVFDLDGRKIPYKVAFSGNKNFSVEFANPDMSLIVHAPYGAPPDVIEKVLSQNRDMIASRLAEVESRREGFEDVLDFRKILVSGEKRTLYIGWASKITGTGVYSKGLEDLMHVYVTKFGQSFTKMVRDVAKRLGVTIGRVEFRSYKKDWGRCGDDVNFFFNYKLMMPPPEYQKFVVAHLICLHSALGQSPDFWKRLEAAVPESKSMYVSMGRYGFILRLYP